MTDGVNNMTVDEQAWLNRLTARMTELNSTHKYFKGMFYGESGVGKTVAAIHLAQKITPLDQRIIYIDSGQNWQSLDNHKPLKSRVDRMTAYSAQMLEDLSVAIQRKMPGFENVGCVVVDEHSTIADMDLLAVTKVRAIRDSGSKDKDEDQPQQPDMYISTNRIRKFTAPLIALDTHLILVAHQRIDKDNMNVPTIAPSYMPKLNIHLRNMLSLVAHSEADEFLTEGGTIDYKRTAQVMPTRKVIAKTRLGGFSGPKVTYAEVNANAYNWLNGDVPTVNEDVIQPEETEPVTETEVNDFAIEIEEVTV